MSYIFKGKLKSPSPSDTQSLFVGAALSVSSKKPVLGRRKAKEVNRSVKGLCQQQHTHGRGTKCVGRRRKGEKERERTDELDHHHPKCIIAVSQESKESLSFCLAVSPCFKPAFFFILVDALNLNLKLKFPNLTSQQLLLCLSLLSPDTQV